MSEEVYKEPKDLRDKIRVFSEIAQDINEDLLEAKFRQEQFKPQYIVSEVASIFQQFSITDAESGIQHTPLLPTEISGQNPECIYINHTQPDEKTDMHSVMNTFSNGPMFLLAKTEKGFSVFDDEYNSYTDEEDLIGVREVVDFLRNGYFDSAYEKANRINMKKYGFYSDFESDLYAIMKFELIGKKNPAAYKPILIEMAEFGEDETGKETLSFLTPAEALLQAVETFYYSSGEWPTPDTPSSVKIGAITVINDGGASKIKPIDIKYFEELMRYKSHFDSDFDLYRQLLLQSRMQSQFN